VRLNRFSPREPWRGGVRRSVIFDNFAAHIVTLQRAFI
jgi:hypothetical protein